MNKKEVKITQGEVQKIVSKLMFSPKEERFSKCLDLLVELKGEYNHEVAHELVKMTNRPLRQGKGRLVSHEEAEALRNKVVFSY